MITGIDSESPAYYENGLREGDMILELNLSEMKTLDDLTKAVKDNDMKLVIKFEREGTTNYQLLTKNSK